MSVVENAAGGIPGQGATPLARLAARGFLAPEELRRFSEIDPLPIARKVATTWGLVLGAIWAAVASRSALVAAAAFVVVSACQHALFLLAHEGAHYSISRRKWLNDLLSDALFAAPIFYTTARYREGHVPHHTHLGDHRLDLERRTWVLLRGAHFARLLARSLSGWAAARAIVGLRPDKVGARQSPLRYAVSVLATNGGLFAYCAALGSPLAYLGLWLLPFCTLTYLLLIVRAVAEHQPASYARRESPDEGVDLVPVLTRTFATGPLERFLFAPVGAHHHEHHLFPGVPFAQLPRLHATLASRGYFDEQPDCMQTSYWALLRGKVLATAQAPPPPAAADVA